MVTGSARKNGNSNTMADSFEKAAKGAGLEVKRIDATSLNVGCCHGCNTCFSTGKACTFNDDFNKIAGDFTGADGIVFATPVYWYTFPAKLKAVIDKFYALFVGKHLFTGKKCALIACCADGTDEAFKGMTAAFDGSFALMGAENVGHVLVNSVSNIGDIKKTDGEKRAAELVKKFLD